MNNTELHSHKSPSAIYHCFFVLFFFTNLNFAYQLQHCLLLIISFSSMSSIRNSDLYIQYSKEGRVMCSCCRSHHTWPNVLISLYLHINAQKILHPLQVIHTLIRMIISLHFLVVIMFRMTSDYLH